MKKYQATITLTEVNDDLSPVVGTAPPITVKLDVKQITIDRPSILIENNTPWPKFVRGSEMTIKIVGDVL